MLGDEKKERNKREGYVLYISGVCDKIVQFDIRIPCRDVYKITNKREKKL